MDGFYPVFTGYINIVTENTKGEVNNRTNEFILEKWAHFVHACNSCVNL